jgi:hypothetical protein
MTTRSNSYRQGSADSWYSRGYHPRIYVGTPGRLVVASAMSPEEIRDYRRGFDDNELHGDKKEWEWDEDDCDDRDDE